jgi:hypothetical protein
MLCACCRVCVSSTPFCVPSGTLFHSILNETSPVNSALGRSVTIRICHYYLWPVCTALLHLNLCFGNVLCAYALCLFGHRVTIITTTTITPHLAPFANWVQVDAPLDQAARKLTPPCLQRICAQRHGPGHLCKACVDMLDQLSHCACMSVPNAGGPAGGPA